MLQDNNMGIPALSPRKTADPAKKKTPPPPVARKPVGLMERITTEKKTDQPGLPLMTSSLLPLTLYKCCSVCFVW